MISELDVPDLADPATFATAVPHEVFDDIRRRPGLYWQPTAYGTQNGGFWAVTRFADILEIERQPDIFTSTRGAAYPGTNLEPSGFSSDQLMHMDPPRHTGVRRTASLSFGPRVVVHFDTWIREIVTEVLDTVEPLAEFDWVSEVASLVPSLVMARVLGVPHRDRQVIVDLTNRMMTAQQTTVDHDATLGAVYMETLAYVSETLVQEKRARPDEDMGTVLTQAADRGDLTVSEATSLLLLLLVAGYETTHTMMGQTLRMMLEDPSVDRDARRGVEELGADKVIDEFLRLITPAMNMARTATRDTEIAGQAIRAGDLMQMYFIAANRDPEVFAEPHRFNPWRLENKSLTFGRGAHYCMGAALGKLELRILLEEMSRRGVYLRLDGEPRRGRSVFINQLLSLPVARVGA